MIARQYRLLLIPRVQCFAYLQQYQSILQKNDNSKKQTHLYNKKHIYIDTAESVIEGMRDSHRCRERGWSANVAYPPIPLRLLLSSSGMRLKLTTIPITNKPATITRSRHKKTIAKQFGISVPCSKGMHPKWASLVSCSRNGTSYTSNTNNGAMNAWKTFAADAMLPFSPIFSCLYKATFSKQIQKLRKGSKYTGTNLSSW